MASSSTAPPSGELLSLCSRARLSLYFNYLVSVPVGSVIAMPWICRAAPSSRGRSSTRPRRWAMASGVYLTGGRRAT